jgi:hypothetical protein
MYWYKEGILQISCSYNVDVFKKVNTDYHCLCKIMFVV